MGRREGREEGKRWWVRSVYLSQQERREYGMNLTLKSNVTNQLYFDTLTYCMFANIILASANSSRHIFY